MQEHLNNGNRYLLVDEVREGAYNPHIKTYTSHNDDQSIVWNIMSWMGIEEEKILPVGQWQLIGLASQLSESEAAEVIELANDQLVDVKGIKHYKDYTSESWEQDYGTAKESLASLLQSLSLSPNTLILKAI